MRAFAIGLSIFIGVIGTGIGLSYAFGWIGVHQTRTIKKERVNAEREVFEQSQSYVEGKRQEAQKLFREYNQAEDDTTRIAIEEIVAMNFANFDESKLNYKLRAFVERCKNGN